MENQKQINNTENRAQNDGEPKHKKHFKQALTGGREWVGGLVGLWGGEGGGYGKKLIPILIPI